MPLPSLIVTGCLIGSTALLTNSGSADPGNPAGAAGRSHQPLLADRVAALDAHREARSEAQLSRSFQRATPTPAATAAVQTAPSPAPAKVLVPVAGLIELQMKNAATIVRVGQQLGLPRRALIIGVATAMQESNLYNTASNAIPESFDYPHQGTSSDYDSVGLFQQRTSQGWGSVADLMRPEYQAERFFRKLATLDWSSMSLTEAAQAVQVSAYPNAYAKHEPRATAIVDAVLACGC